MSRSSNFPQLENTNVVPLPVYNIDHFSTNNQIPITNVEDPTSPVRTKGRPSNNRIKNCVEKYSNKYNNSSADKCSICKQVGHNRSTCSKKTTAATFVNTFSNITTENV